jgi:hypothetical protein
MIPVLTHTTVYITKFYNDEEILEGIPNVFFYQFENVYSKYDAANQFFECLTMEPRHQDSTVIYEATGTFFTIKPITKQKHSKSDILLDCFSDNYIENDINEKCETMYKIHSFTYYNVNNEKVRIDIDERYNIMYFEQYFNIE